MSKRAVAILGARINEAIDKTIGEFTLSLAELTGTLDIVKTERTLASLGEEEEGDSE